LHAPPKEWSLPINQEKHMQHHTGLAEIAHLYDGFLFDIWGVIHDGTACFPAARACLHELHTLGKPYTFLSNMPRRAKMVSEALVKLGMEQNLTATALTSGEATRRFLQSSQRDFGNRVLFQGPERTKDIITGLDIVEVQTVAEADFVLISGIGDEETPADYSDLLNGALTRGLPMICANPDLRVGHGRKLVACAGLLAEAYENMGGRVIWMGKPHGLVYQMARDVMGVDNLLMVGDSLRTDIAGAKAAGMATLFLTDGIHREDIAGDHRKLEALTVKYAVKPDHVLPNLIW
jgi:HAD superfamily hydrolase (TIGR01459 family)